MRLERGIVRLELEEAAGGHTIGRHVGKTEAELRARLLAEPTVPAASTFGSLGEAEVAIGRAFQKRSFDIQYWASSAAVGRKFTFVCDLAPGRAGLIMRQGSTVATYTTKLTIVLKKSADSNTVYYVLTAFPSF